jgi:hypothetical protein
MVRELLFHRATMEVFDLLRSILLRTQCSKVLSVSSAAKVMVVDVVEAVVIEEAVEGRFQILAEMTSKPSLVL